MILGMIPRSLVSFMIGATSLSCLVGDHLFFGIVISMLLIPIMNGEMKEWYNGLDEN